jgi:hypothetical protein
MTVCVNANGRDWLAKVDEAHWKGYITAKVTFADVVEDRGILLNKNT